MVPHFKGDDLGWTSGELHLTRGSPVMLECYVTKVDDLRDDLNAFAAELETVSHNSNNVLLMERVIQTQQMMTVRRPIDAPDEIAMHSLIQHCCHYLATACDGVYQVDGRGWFAADGMLLLQEY